MCGALERQIFEFGMQTLDGAGRTTTNHHHRISIRIEMLTFTSHLISLTSAGAFRLVLALDLVAEN